MPNDKARLIAIGGVVSFIAGCLVGSSAEPTGLPHCVVSEDSKSARGGVLAGQVVEADETVADDADAVPGDGDAPGQEPGCLPGEQRVCGWIDRSHPEAARFVSQRCPR